MNSKEQEIMRPQTIIKLAYFTRRFSRYEHPFMYRFSRMLLNLTYSEGRHNILETVVPYDQGLININTVNSHEYKLLFFHSYEKEISGIIKRIVKPGDVCIDIGANIGGLTLIMAHIVGSHGKVIAVEPHPLIAQRLKANLELNRLNNCCIIQAAISDKEGKATLYTPPDNAFNQGLSSLSPSKLTPNQIIIDTIRGIRLTEDIDNGTCTFVKIDVEGHDLIVLKELKEIITNHRPHIIIEYSRDRWEKNGGTFEQVMEFLSDFNYSVYYIKRDIIFPIISEVPDYCDLMCVPNLSYKAQPNAKPSSDLVFKA